MSQSLGTLFVELQANTAKFVEPLSKAAYLSQQSAKNISKEFSSLQRVASQTFGAFGAFNPAISQASFLFSSLANASVSLSRSLQNVGKSMGDTALQSRALGAIGGIVGVIAGAGIAAAAGMAALAVSGVEVVHRLEMISEKTGISIRDLQTFEAAGKTVGVSLEDMVTAMRKFDQSITGTARNSMLTSAVLKNLGVTARDNKEALLEVADAFAKMEDGPRKAADAVALFGRSGLNMIPFLNKGRDGIEEFNNMVDQYGPKIGKDAVAATEAWEKSTTKLSLAWDSLKLKALGALTPITSALAEVVRTMTDMGDPIARLGKQMQQLDAKRQAEFPFRLSVTPATSQWSKQDTDRARQQFDVLEAGGPAQAKLKQMKEAIAAATQSEDAAEWQIAINLQKQIPAQERLAALEKERNKAEQGLSLAKKIEQMTKALQEEIATVGMDADAKKRWELADEGATAATLAGTRALQSRAVVVVLMKKLQDEYVAAHPTGMTIGNVRGNNALFGEKRMEALNLPKQGEDILARLGPLAPIPTPQLEFATPAGVAAAQAKAMIEDLQREMADFGKTPIQLQIESLGPAALPEQIEQLKQLDKQLKILQAGGFLQWQKQLSDENTRMVHGWDEGALAVGNFGERWRAMINELVIQSESMGQKITGTFSHALDSLTGELAKLVITGRSNFRQLVDGMAEELLKASFQNTISGLATLLIGKPKIPGQQAAEGAQQATPGIASRIGAAFGLKTEGGPPGIAGSISKIFGIHAPGIPGGVKPDGSKGSPFYVVMTAGAALSGVSNLPLARKGGLLPNLSSSSGEDSGGDSGAAAGGLSSIFKDLAGGISKAGSVFSSIFKGLFSFLHFSEGGQTPAGRAFMVGEKGPEILSFNRPGFVTPNRALRNSGSSSQGGAQHYTTVNMHIHGVQDFDSFRRSQSQVYASMHAQLALANSRNS